MQPDPLRGLPVRALCLYVAVVAPLVMVAALAFGQWLDSHGLSWLLGLAVMMLAVRLLLLAAGPLSVPAIYWLVGRWPALGRGRLLGEMRGGSDAA